MPASAVAEAMADHAEAARSDGGEGSVEIILNGQPRSIPASLNLQAVLKSCDVTDVHVAVAVNDTVIPRSQHTKLVIHNGDRIEIIRAVGGG